MPFDTDQQELLRRSFDIEISRVGPAPDLEMLLHRSERVRLQKPTVVSGWRVALPLIAAVAATGAVVAGAVFISGQDSAAPGAGESSTTSPTTRATTLVDGEVWLSTGEPISDERYLSLVGERASFGFIPGTAIRLAWTAGYADEFEIGLFGIQQEISEVDDGGPWYCLTSYAARIGSGSGDHAGGTRCARTAEDLRALLSDFGLGASGNCVDTLNEVHVWGVPADVVSVEVALRDGTNLTAEVDESGFALFAWDHDTPWIGITYDGISAEDEALVESWIPEPPMSCAEMSAAKPG